MLSRLWHDGYMDVFSWLTIAVMAAETVLSPLADNSFQEQALQQPTVTFGQLASTTTLHTATVLGVQTVAPHAPSITPTKTVYQTKKKHYTIALLGDSMIDTLGPDAPHLKRSLTNVYPSTTFTILNYGVGATNIDYGLTRIASGYTYLGIDRPSLTSQQPDIVVIESFGYNPYPDGVGSLQKHWQQLGTMVSTLRSHIPGVRIVIAVTIAPNSKSFGDGAPGLAFSPEDKKNRTDTIKSYLDSTVKFARGEQLPLANAFHASLDAHGDGILGYINPGDHIHYSDRGRALMAQKISDAIRTNHLLD